MRYFWSNLVRLLRAPLITRINSNKGFTLLETLVTMGLTVVIGLFMIKGLSFFDKSKDELSKHISTAGSLLHAQRVIMRDLSSNRISFNASGKSGIAKLNGPPRDFFVYGRGEDGPKSFVLKQGGTFNFITSIAYEGLARKIHLAESAICVTSDKDRCKRIADLKSLFGEVWGQSNFFVFQSVIPDVSGSYPSFLAMKQGSSLVKVPDQYKYWRNWLGETSLQKFFRSVKFFGSEPTYRVEPVQIIQYFIDPERNLLRHVFLPDEIHKLTFKPTMANSTYLLTVSDKFNLTFQRKSIYSMQISIDFPSFLVAHNLKLQRERENKNRFSFINELRADAVEGGMFGNVSASRVVTLVQAGVHGFVPAPVPFVSGTLSLDVYCITHNFRSRWDLRNYGVDRYSTDKVYLKFQYPNAKGNNSGKIATGSEIAFDVGEIANGNVRGYSIHTDENDMLNMVLTKKIFLTEAKQGSKQLVWYSSGAHDRSNSWGWGTINGNHNAIRVNCEEKAKGTDNVYACNTHVVFLPNFSGYRGTCGGFKSPLMLFFDGQIPRFGATSMFKLDEEDLRHSWPESGNNAYFVVADRNQNGKIEDYNEIFATDPGSNAFEKLAAYDSNKDGVVSPLDKGWKLLSLWNDKNANSHADPGELRTMKDLGVKSISVMYDRVDVTFGPLAKADTVSEFVYERDGKNLKGDCYDVYFKVK